MITLVGTRKTRGFRPVWLLEELGVEYDHIPAMPGSAEIRAHQPSGKVPALIVDGQVIGDSVAIMAYLSDRFGKFTFPSGSVERGIQDAHVNFILDEMDAVLWTAARHTFVLPEEHRVPAVKDSLKWEFKRNLARFVARLGDGPYLMGDTFTIADIVACHCGMWATNAKFPMDEQPAFLAYVDRLKERPAYQRALEKE